MDGNRRMAISKSFRIGADIGGTFTDVAVLDERGRVGVAKVSTTPRNFTEGVVRAIDIALEQYSVDRSSVSLLAHATTIVTNALLEEKGAKVALITTRGFRDVLELRRSARADLYDLLQDAPSVLVARRHRVEVTERINAQGEVTTALDETEIEPIIAKLKEWAVEAVAVSLLFSFINDSHERLIGQRLREALPNIPVFLSSEVLPEIREFERTSTTAVCAYVAPILQSYLRELERQVVARGLPAPYIMGSSGGVLSIDEALQVPAMVVESGPAAGVIAAAAIGKQLGRENLISFDMGGTTAKASLIQHGRIETTPEYEVGGTGSVSRWLVGTGHPIRVPVIDLAEVSAGGGSIAWVDPAGALRVGPQSAGAEPGPVCYQQGGDAPTVTDANLVLGRLDQSSLLGGELLIDVAAARQAITQKIADPLGLEADAAAAGVLDIVNNAMAEALRTVSVERGHDPREFSLVAFGGAGPLHAASLAEELEIGEVVVPPIAGAFSALGLVGTDIKRDYARTYFKALATVAPEEIDSVYQELEETANAMLTRCGIDESDRVLERSADLRYLRQAYELNVMTGDGAISAAKLATLSEGFHAKHQSTYGHANRHEGVQVVTLRVTAIGKLSALELDEQGSSDETSEKAKRSVWFKNSGWVTCPIHERNRLRAGATLDGPAIVDSHDSTIVLPPSWQLTRENGGFIIMKPVAKV